MMVKIIHACMKCDYALHEECAYLPSVKQHDHLHAHSLNLDTCYTQAGLYCEC